MRRTRFALLTALLCLTFVAGLGTRRASADQCEECNPTYYACVSADPNNPSWVHACRLARNNCIAMYCR